MNHEETVQNITEQLKQRRTHAPVSFIRQGVSHKVPNTKTSTAQEKIHLPPLTKILEIDPINKTCAAESGVTFAQLVEETLKHGLVPYTVPELKTITIGGAVSGGSIESMSYKHGGFHDSCLEYEVITAQGERMICSPSQNSEVFHMLHGSFGTLGIITKIKFRLHPAKPYVKLNYVHYKTFDEYQAAIQNHYHKQDHDFIDGIIHGPKHFTLCLGNFTKHAPYTNNYEKMKIFYKTTKNGTEDYLTTHDYFFRYDADCHWISRNYGLENPIARFLFGRWFLSSTKMIRTAKKLQFLFKRLKPELIVDVFIPISRFKNFYQFYEKEFNYYPLWIVPYRIAKRYPWMNNQFMEGLQDELYIDCAIYGMRQHGNKDYYHIMDQKLIELQSIKTLISHNSYDRETFWKIYNQENYNRAKQLTDPHNIFKDLYEKTHK